MPLRHRLGWRPPPAIEVSSYPHYPRRFSAINVGALVALWTQGVQPVTATTATTCAFPSADRSGRSAGGVARRLRCGTLRRRDPSRMRIISAAMKALNDDLMRLMVRELEGFKRELALLPDD